MMKRQLPLLLLLCSTAHAQTSPMANDIHQGRAALVAGQPEHARALFTAALAHPDGNRADAAAAALGLGQSSLWLGRYAAAATAFRTARVQADDAGTQQAADTGLAQALNAQDYPRKAYALVAPFAKGQQRPTLQLLRAAQSLGWQDKTPAYLQAVTSPVTYWPSKTEASKCVKCGAASRTAAHRSSRSWKISLSAPISFASWSTVLPQATSSERAGMSMP